MYPIVGFIDFNFDSSYPLEETITSMRDTLTHVGPDDTMLSLLKESRQIETFYFYFESLSEDFYR